MNDSLLICGFGYTAQHLVRRPELTDLQIIGTTRQPQAQTTPAVKYIEFLDENIRHHLARSSHVLLCIPPQANGADPMFPYRDHLKAAPDIKWIGYLSSTGIYGDHQGAWVNEQSASINPGVTGTRRLNIEQSWIQFAREHHLPFHVFRLAGIYGLGRNALERILHGKSYSIYKEGHFFSRIHVDDICTALIASMINPQPGAIYNLADDEPAAAHEVDSFACQLLGRTPLPLIPWDTAQLTLREIEFYTHNRRVENSYIKKSLNIQLRYPSYRDGLLELHRHLELKCS
ncbi:MAG: SDR family oxidoreductase [Legionella sp.]|nr:SDR family oxidoreductase [Legionella sp.]